MAGTGGSEQGVPPPGIDHTARRDSEPPPAPDRFWNVILPAIGAVIILGAGIVGQCFGG